MLRTFASVFEHVSVWFTLGPDLLLLGIEDPEQALDIERLRQRFERPDFTAGFARVGIESFTQLLAHELLPLGTLHAAGLEGELHTLGHPILSDLAARAFFVGHQGRLPNLAQPEVARVGSANSLLRRHALDASGRLSELEWKSVAGEICGRGRVDHCATALAGWQRERRGSVNRLRLLKALRKSEFGPELDKTTLSNLAALFGGKALRSLSDEESLSRAIEMTGRFERHFHHALPFDRRVLEDVWNRCRHDGCEAPRQRAVERLGPIPRR